ncbi:MAG: hypothetical protein L6R42_001523 [Xanthoria sp. 1 TBL-2021]|nr:MAG: hypothetical protein L6R42_001523 [Xanthoria sp. 1 TBL-2021]
MWFKEHKLKATSLGNCLRGGFVCEGYTVRNTWQKPTNTKVPIPLQSKNGGYPQPIGRNGPPSYSRYGPDHGPEYPGPPPMGQGMHPSHDGGRMEPMFNDEDRNQDYNEGPNGQEKPSRYAKATTPYPSNPTYASKYGPGDERPASNHDNASYPAQESPPLQFPEDHGSSTSTAAPAVSDQPVNNQKMAMDGDMRRAMEVGQALRWGQLLANLEDRPTGSKKRKKSASKRSGSRKELELRLKEQEAFNMSIPKTRTPTSSPLAWALHTCDRDRSTGPTVPLFFNGRCRSNSHADQYPLPSSTDSGFPFLSPLWGPGLGKGH